jgi:hypothetical protein
VAGIGIGSDGGVFGKGGEDDEFLILTLSSPSRSSAMTAGSEKIILLSTVTDLLFSQ